jgi:hypothetical protein
VILGSALRDLRAELFVDLYAVVRHAIRAGVESYSIKKLEPLFGFKRAQALDESGTALIKVQACLELGDIDSILAQDKNIIQAYNREDCLAAAELRQWLEQLRSQQITNGYRIRRPTPKPGEANEEIAEWQQRIAPIIERLTRDVPVEPKDRTTAQHARWILAYILDWHRREQKATWWEHFRLRDLSAEDCLMNELPYPGSRSKPLFPLQGGRRYIATPSCPKTPTSGPTPSSAALVASTSAPSSTSTKKPARSPSRSARTPQNSIQPPSTPMKSLALRCWPSLSTALPNMSRTTVSRVMVRIVPPAISS